MRGSERQLERLGWEDWSALLAHTIRYAEVQMRRRCPGWREGLVLSGGHEAMDVASEVVAGVLGGKCRLAPGWTRSRLEAELERQVSRELRRLSSRREAGVTVSEWVVLPRDEAGEAQSVFDEMAGSMADGYEEASRNGEGEEWEEAREELEASLNGDTIARGVLRCLRKGLCKRREIAANLGVKAKAVTAARKRLERKARRLKRRG